MQSMIAWRDGIEESPGGPAREVVQRDTWSSSVWITPDGEAFRRHYNAVSARPRPRGRRAREGY